MFGQIGPTEFDVNFRAFGVPVRVHPIFWLTSAWLAWSMTPKGPQLLPLLIVGILCIFLAILVHELGHALMNLRFGFRSEIVLYFLGGYATSTRHSTWRDIAVSAAGPGAGFLLFGVVLLLEFAYGPLLSRRADQGDQLAQLAEQALDVSFFINLLWNIVNLFPVSPLDGGQISREFFLWLRPRDGFGIHLQLAMLVSGAIAAYSLYCYSRHQSVFGLDGLFLGLMFGYLCFQNFQMYQQHHGGGHW